MKFGARSDDVLRDPGRGNPPLTGLEDDLAPLRPKLLCTKGAPGWGPGSWRAGQKITQPSAVGQEFRGSAAEPLRQCPVYKAEVSSVVDRIKSDRRIVYKAGEIVPLLPDRRLRSMRRTDVLNAPIAKSR